MGFLYEFRFWVYTICVEYRYLCHPQCSYNYLQLHGNEISPLSPSHVYFAYHQGDYNIMFILLACFLASSSVIIFFKTPTPIGTVW